MSYQKFHVLYGCRQGETFDETECLDVGYEVNGYDVASLAIQPGSVSFSVLDYSYGPDDPTRAKVLNLLKKNGFASIFEPEMFASVSAGLSITDSEQVEQILNRTKNFLKSQKNVSYRPLKPTYEYELEKQLKYHKRYSR